eukprot:1305679-Ditylum_brightwellii.AAC.1
MYCCCGGGVLPFLGGLDPGGIETLVRKGLQSLGLEVQSFGGWPVEKGRSTETQFSFEFQIDPPGGPSEREYLDSNLPSKQGSIAIDYSLGLCIGSTHKAGKLLQGEIPGNIE